MVYEIEARTLERCSTAVVRARMGVEDVGPWLEGVYGRIAAHVGRHGSALVGAPFGRYVEHSDGTLEVEAGFAVSSEVPGVGDIEPSSLPAGTAAATWHVGPYDEMVPAYEALERWIAEKGGSIAEPAWEIYHTDPSVEADPAVWRTEIVQPYRTS